MSRIDVLYNMYTALSWQVILQIAEDKQNISKFSVWSLNMLLICSKQLGYGLFLNKTVYII